MRIRILVVFEWTKNFTLIHNTRKFWVASPSIEINMTSFDWSIRETSIKTSLKFSIWWVNCYVTIIKNISYKLISKKTIMKQTILAIKKVEEKNHVRMSLWELNQNSTLLYNLENATWKKMIISSIQVKMNFFTSKNCRITT